MDGLKIGSNVTLTVTHQGTSATNFAVRVRSNVPSVNQFPHITLCVHPQGKPAHSNNINTWIPVFPEIPLTGFISEYVTSVSEK